MIQISLIIIHPPSLRYILLLSLSRVHLCSLFAFAMEFKLRGCLGTSHDIQLAHTRQWMCIILHHSFSLSGCVSFFIIFSLSLSRSHCNGCVSFFIILSLSDSLSLLHINTQQRAHRPSFVHVPISPCPSCPCFTYLLITLFMSHLFMSHLSMSTCSCPICSCLMSLPHMHLSMSQCPRFHLVRAPQDLFMSPCFTCPCPACPYPACPCLTWPCSTFTCSAYPSLMFLMSCMFVSELCYLKDTYNSSY